MSLSRRDLLAALPAVPLLTQAAYGAGKPVRGGTLTASIGYPEPHTMYAPAGGGGGPAFTSSKVLEPLVRQQADRSFAPVLGLKWTPAKDFKSFKVDLRQGVQWHDGRPFTADDVAFSATQSWKPLSPGGVFKVLDKVDTPDRYTAIFQFQRPIPELSFLTQIDTNHVIPKHLYQGQNIFTSPVNNAPVGTGPWKFKQWFRGSYAQFEANRHYWIPDRPYLDQLIIRWWRDPASRAAALESGELDIGVTNPVPLGDVQRLQRNPNITVWRDRDGAPQGVALYFNVRNPILAKKQVRQALLYAINRKFIADTIYFGFAKPSVNPIFTANKDYFTPDVPTYNYDPAKAAKLLDQAGYPVRNGTRFSIRLHASGWSEENGKVGAYIRQVLSDLKIATTFKVPDRPTSLKTLYTDYDFDIGYSQGGGAVGDPVPALTMLYTSAGILPGVPFRNASGYHTPQMDGLVEQITYEVDPAKRRKLVQDFAKLAGDEVPLFPLVEWSTLVVSRKNVHTSSTALSLGGDSWGDFWRA